MKATAPIKYPVNITSGSSFDVAVLENPMPVLVTFWAPWCPPCKALAPTLNHLAAEYAGRVLVAKVNVDEETALAREFGIRAIPTLLLFAHGEVTERLTGNVPKGILKHYLGSCLPQSPN